MIESQQTNNLTNVKYKGDYNTALPALNVLYHLTEDWNLYANTEGSFGSVQYSQMPNRVTSGEVKPEKPAPGNSVRVMTTAPCVRKSARS